MKKIGNLNIVNVAIPPFLLGEIDEWTVKTGRSRSEFFREGARRLILSLKKEEKYDN